MLFKKKQTSILDDEKKEADQEHATVIRWTPKWSAGAPLPQVFSNGSKTYLIYLIDLHDPDWVGTYVSEINNNIDSKYHLALVEFDGKTFKFGIANDEVFSGLPLWNKGLGPDDAYIIKNSSWIKELKAIHKVHPYYNEALWINRKHYMLLFHDEIFEVIASGYKIDTFYMSFEELSIEVSKKMNRKEL